MSRFLFGPFEFDSGTLDLRRDGAPVRLQSQPAHVLKALLENADQIVTRDQLRRALWDDFTFVDFESGLNFCISQLRAALRDDASQPLYIRTVPKKGYQLIAPVRPALVPAPRLQPSDENFPRSRFSPRLLITSAIIIALIVVSLFLMLRPRHVQPASPIVAVARFDNETGNPAFDSFANNLTDNVVEELATRSSTHDRVIGNAKILFVRRQQRDLRSIASDLNAAHIVLGQVQSTGDRVRVLAHLIRASDQTHIWVVRIDRPANGILQFDDAMADQIASELSSRLADNPDKAASFKAVGH